MHKRPISVPKLRKVPPQFSWVDQRLVRDGYIEQLSHEACALYLFLVTVADAQGLSFYSERSLCQRLSMTPAVIRRARQALIACALVAYQPPLYQPMVLVFGKLRNDTGILQTKFGHREGHETRRVGP